MLTIFFLTNYLGLVIQESTGTVLAASAVMVLLGALSFYRKGQVNTQLALTVGLSGVASAFLAARWASTIESTTLEEAFGGFTLILALYIGYRFVSEWQSKKGKVPDWLKNLDSVTPGTVQAEQAEQAPSRWSGSSPAALGVQIGKGALIGAATGLFGVGLASVSVVLFFLLFKLETNVILGTSLFASFFRYLGGSVGYLSTGQINPFYFLILVAGGGLGSIVGARFLLRGESGSRDPIVKLVIVAIMVFISYEFLLKRLF